MDCKENETYEKYNRLTSRKSTKTDPRFRRTRSPSTESSEPVLLRAVDAEKYGSPNPSSQGDIKPIITMKPKVKETEVTGSTQIQMKQKTDENIIKYYIATLLDHENRGSDNDRYKFRQNHGDTLREVKPVDVIKPKTEEVVSQTEISKPQEDENNIQTHSSSNLKDCVIKDSDSDLDYRSCVQEERVSSTSISQSSYRERKEESSHERVPLEVTADKTKCEHVLPENETPKKNLLDFGYFCKYAGPPIILLIILCGFVYAVSQQPEQKEEISYIRSVTTRMFGWTIHCIIYLFDTVLGFVLPNDDAQEEETWNLFK